MPKSAQKKSNKQTDKPLLSKNILRLAFFLIGSFFFGLFALFTLIVKHDTLRSFDFNTTVRLQDKIPLKFDNFFSFLSVAGRFELSIIILLLILIFRKKIMGALVVILFGLGHVIEIIGKNFLNQPGPPHMFLRTTNFSTQFPGLYVDTQDTYPSGHSLRVLFLSVVIIYIIFKSKKLNTEVKVLLIFLVILYAFLMLLSRVALGEHWTTDVIGGTLLGLSFGFFSLIFL